MTWGRPAPAFERIERIAVLRGGGLGDILFAFPAIEALADAYPGAEITLLSTPLSRALLEGRPSPVDDIQLLPVAEGVYSPEGEERGEDAPALADFLDTMRSRRFDLALQLHGGGRFSNPFVLALGARHTVGAATPDAAPLERILPYVHYQHETLRWLEVAALAGAPPTGLEPVVRVTGRERREARGRLLDSAGLVVIHPGAMDPRRRWPASGFAEIAALCAGSGHQVIVVGAGEDVELAAEIVAAAGPASPGMLTSLAGELSLSQLAGLLSWADVFVGNDSGPRHLAQAVGTATAGIYWVGNLITAGPLARERHRVQLSWLTHCPVCGRDSTQPGWKAERCEHQVSFVAEVAVEDVYQDVRSLMAGTAPARGR